ncbi:MAG: chorismate synthase [Bacteroidetes bacterium]|nr:chorismate synthase [Bacteroidota bacterium]MDF2453250.1 chorismate synthase [Bacteroidota bacterium]
MQVIILWLIFDQNGYFYIMAGNTFGTLFRLTTFGESHGAAIGGILDGCPAGLEIDIEFIQKELQRRKPGQSYITTQRKEEDKVNFLSGIFEGKTTGHPIGFTIENTNQKSTDYEHIKDTFRPSHADFTYQEKYGIRDYRGGGRSSARETACRIVGGAIAKLYLNHLNISVQGYVSQVGPIKLEKSYKDLDLTKTDESIIRCPDAATAYKMVSYIEDVRKDGDTIGGIVSCVVKGTPIGLGEPVFDKLHADLGKAMLSINAVKGFEYGEGFNSVNFKGSEMNDVFLPFDSAQGDKKVRTLTNHSGGIQGGISNGEDIYFNVAFKPVATIMQDQQSIDKDGNETTIKGKGRHDPCVLPRAVPIVESMAALVLVDHILRNKTSKI